MGIFRAFHQRRADLSAPDGLATLAHMEQYFLGGKRWIQGAYHQGGSSCLVGAADKVKVSKFDAAKCFLRQAIIEQTQGAHQTIEGFNDSRKSFAEIEAVITRAKQLAIEAQPHAPVEIIPPRQTGWAEAAAQRAASPNNERPPVIIDVEPLP